MPEIRISERELQTQAIELAQLRGWLCHHSRPARRADGEWRTPIQGDKGFPDVVFVHPSGLVIFAEFKSASGRMSAEQRRWESGLRQADFGSDDILYRVWRPDDWPEIEHLLKDGML